MKSKLRALVLLSISLSAASDSAPPADAQTHRAVVPGAAPPAQGSAGSARGDFAFSVNGARENANNLLGSPTFGRVTSARDPRHIQFGAKLLF